MTTVRSPTASEIGLRLLAAADTIFVDSNFASFNKCMFFVYHSVISQLPVCMLYYSARHTMPMMNCFKLLWISVKVWVLSSRSKLLSPQEHCTTRGSRANDLLWQNLYHRNIQDVASKETGEQRSSTSPEASEDSLQRPCFEAKDYSRVPAGSWPQHTCQQASLNCHVTVFPVNFFLFF